MNGEAISLEQQRELVAKCKAKVRHVASPAAVHAVAVDPSSLRREFGPLAQRLQHGGIAAALKCSLRLFGYVTDAKRCSLLMPKLERLMLQVDAATAALDSARAPRAAIRTAPLGCDRDGAAYWRLQSAPLLTGEPKP